MEYLIYVKRNFADPILYATDHGGHKRLKKGYS